MDKILRIDVGAQGGPKATVTPVGNYAGLGGRALTSALVSKEVPPLCHPLGADNKLIIAPGLLSGTTAAMSGRLSVGCKSPLTGGIKEANAGGANPPRCSPDWDMPPSFSKENPRTTLFTRCSSTKMG